MSRRPPMLSVLAAALMLTSSACDDSSEGTCRAPDELLAVTMEGDCSPLPVAFNLEVTRCAVRLAATEPLPVPTQGALDQDQDSLRDGGWQTFGNVNGRFMRCSARRVSWYLQLTCVDGDGRVACTAQIHE